MESVAKSRRKSTARSHKKGDATRAHILKAARDCFNRMGISEVTCRTIAEHAGLSSGNVYYYFDNKDIILGELRLELESATRNLLAGISARRMNTDEDRRALADQWMDMVWTWRFIFQDIHQLTRGNSRTREALLDIRRESVSLHQELFEEHLINRGLDLTPKDKAFCHNLAITNWIIATNWLQHLCLEKGELEITREDFKAGMDPFLTLWRLFYDDSLQDRLRGKPLS